jgi:hypothetical protein
MAIEASKSLFKTAILIRPALARLLIGTSGVESQPVIGPSLWAATPRTHLASLNAPRTHRTGRPHPPLTSVRYVQILSSIVAHLALRGRPNLGSRYATEAAHSAPALQVRSLAYRCRFRSDVRRVISVQIL